MLFDLELPKQSMNNGQKKQILVIDKTTIYTDHNGWKMWNGKMY